jgi:hypothetical protein
VGAESDAILIESGVDKNATFSDEATAALPGPGWLPDQSEVARRRDLRVGPAADAVCSVDPPGCAAGMRVHTSHTHPCSP